ncbi:NYN domain-containing protein [Candidatus Saccharibacteria bacterium]|nr:NYN domain-containing protein [Candidatus Saccharibacteria bacterium]
MNQAFIDGQNLRYSTTHADKPWSVDLARLRIYLAQKYNVDRAYYFLGYQMESQQFLYRKIQEAGYILLFRQHNAKMNSIKKGNVDTDIVFTIMQKIADREKFDKIILVSGDGDYYKMVQYLIKKDKFGKLLAPNGKNMSSLYIDFSTKYYDFLNKPGIKSKIQYTKKNKKAGSA